MSAFRRMPVLLPGGALLTHASGRLRQEQIDALYWGSGGFDRALAWINKSDDNYGDFFKLWARGAARPPAVIETGADADSIETLLARLDAGEHARVVDGGQTQEDEA